MLKFLLLFFFHPHFVSTTHIDINVKQNMVQVSSEYFADDLESALQKLNKDIKIDLTKRLPQGDSLNNILQNYILDNFYITLNSKTKLSLQLVGFELVDGKCVFFIESPLPQKEKIISCTVTNKIMSSNHHQEHMIFVKNNGTEQSFKLNATQQSHIFSF